jgi:hypothetical protein
MSTSLNRRLALRVHALSSRDQRWALAQLPETIRAEVARLLAELKSKGVPGDLATALAERGTAPWVSPEFGELRAAMDGLNPAWAARMLAAARSPNAQAVIHSLPADRAGAVQFELNTHPALPSALETFLQGELSDARPPRKDSVA